jgi:hypothetical protein
MTKKSAKSAHTQNVPKLLAQITTLILIIALVAVYGLQQLKPSHAATPTGTFSLTPSGGAYQVGNVISATIYEDSGSDDVGVVQADLTYNSSLLAFKALDDTGSQFSEVAPAATVGTGTLSISRGSTTPRTGNQKVTTVEFTVLNSGTASVAFANSSIVYRQSDFANIYTGSTGGTYTAQAPATTPPITTPPVTPPLPITTPAMPTIPTSTANKTTPSAKPATTAYTPAGTTTPVTAATNTPLVTNKNFTAAPVNTQATTTSGDTIDITQVQYLLNNKVVATVKTAPFSYSVETKKLRNGTYDLTTKTTYSDGHTEIDNQQIKVNNRYNLTQLSLDAKHYAWLSVPLSVLLVAAIGLSIYVMLRSRQVASRRHAIFTASKTGSAVTNSYDDSTIVQPTEKRPFDR